MATPGGTRRPRIEDKLGRHSDTELENGFASPEAGAAGGRQQTSELTVARHRLEVRLE